MGTIVISDFITLDGVVEDPAGDEGFRLGGWVGAVSGQPAVAQVLLDEALGTAALLLGRRTYDFLAARWPGRTGALADRLNGLPKHVVSSTLAASRWENTAIVDGEVVEAVTRLRQRVDGEIHVPGSLTLVRTLLVHDLVDELRLRVYPVVLGAGARLFGDAIEPRAMRLIEARPLGGGVAALTYARVRSPSAG